jgi:hypothetical protein
MTFQGGSMQLNAYQQARIERAKGALAEARAAGPDAGSLAYALGAAGWWLEDMINLVESLTGDDQ